MAAAVRAALRICADEPARRERCSALIALRRQRARRALRHCRVRVADPAGDRRRRRAGDARWPARCSAAASTSAPIRPPTVPEGTARLRIVADAQRRRGKSSTDLAAALAEELQARRMSARIVVTGTDTDVGKTVFAAGARRRARRVLLEAGAGGARGRDRLRHRAAAGRPAAARVSARSLSADHAAVAAPRRRDRRRDDRSPRAASCPNRGSPLVIEGAGGVLVPLTRATAVRSICSRAGRLPVVLVARTRLGTINHSLLSIEALRARDDPDPRRRLRRRRERGQRAHDRRLWARCGGSAGCRCRRRPRHARATPLPTTFDTADFVGIGAMNRLARSGIRSPSTGCSRSRSRSRGARGRLARNARRRADPRCDLVLVGDDARPSPSAHRAAIAEQAERLDQIIFAGCTHEPAEDAGAPA